MDDPSLLETARLSRGLTQEAVARRSDTSQPTLSAYERGVKSPTVRVARRILHALGFDLGLTPRVTFHEVRHDRSAYAVPDQLWRLAPNDCFVPFSVPGRSGQQRFDPVDRTSRLKAYLWLLEHGDETQLFTRLDGVLLVDLWPDLVPHLPSKLRDEWRPLVTEATEGWFIEQLRAGRPVPPKPVGSKVRERAIRRLAEHGLSADEIRAVLDRRRL
ncbi:MAG: helix-turn-helix domain-containing protein [Nocardioides sp.]|nr:helix-turn-helix domain-containing protein [Nocardioides sp.]